MSNGIDFVCVCVCVCGLGQCNVSDQSGSVPVLYKYTTLLFTSVPFTHRAKAWSCRREPGQIFASPLKDAKKTFAEIPPSTFPTTREEKLLMGRGNDANREVDVRNNLTNRTGDSVFIRQEAKVMTKSLFCRGARPALHCENVLPCKPDCEVKHIADRLKNSE